MVMQEKEHQELIRTVYLPKAMKLIQRIHALLLARNYSAVAGMTTSNSWTAAELEESIDTYSVSLGPLLESSLKVCSVFCSGINDFGVADGEIIALQQRSQLALYIGFADDGQESMHVDYDLNDDAGDVMDLSLSFRIWNPGVEVRPEFISVRVL